MRRCKLCNQWIETPPGFCWRCDPGARSDAEFSDAPQRESSQDSDSEPQPPARQFSLRTLMIVVTAAAVLLGLLQPNWAPLFPWLILVIVINVIGMLAGMFVTHGLKLPNDGSLGVEEELDGEFDCDPANHEVDHRVLRP